MICFTKTDRSSHLESSPVPSAPQAALSYVASVNQNAMQVPRAHGWMSGRGEQCQLFWPQAHVLLGAALWCSSEGGSVNYQHIVTLQGRFSVTS